MIIEYTICLASLPGFMVPEDPRELVEPKTCSVSRNVYGPFGYTSGFL